MIAPSSSSDSKPIWAKFLFTFVFLAQFGSSFASAQPIKQAGPIKMRTLPAKLRSLPACAEVGQQIELKLNTGTSGGVPTADNYWTITSPASTPFSTVPFSAPSLWLPNSATEKWIQPSASGTPASIPSGTYIFSTQFVTPVDPFLYTSITLSGDIAADDMFAVKLNGVPLGACAPGSTSSTWCFHSWRAITPASDWHAFNRNGNFLNTLTVEVKNTAPSSPTGLIVRARVSATCSKCTTPLPPPSKPCGSDPSTC